MTSTISSTQKEPTHTQAFKELKSLTQESEQIYAEISNVVKDIVPLEFESYTDYFIIHTFKKGKSESGKVDMLDLRRRDHTQYYQKIKRSSSSNKSNTKGKDNLTNQPQNNTGTASVTPPPSSSSSLDYLHKLNDPMDEDEKTIRSKTGPTTTTPDSSTENKQQILQDGDDSPIDSISDGVDVDDLEDIYDSDQNPSSLDRPDNTNNNDKISGDITEQSIIEPPEQDTSLGYRRRSSRISKKQEQKKLERQEQLRQTLLNAETKILSEQVVSPDTIPEGVESDQEGEHNDVKDLYESLVPKVKAPTRRSDWVLPPRLKFQPEKQIRTKVVVESIKVHELIDTDRIMKVLSRFEGGVAGIRKTFNNNRPVATTVSSQKSD